MSQLLKPWAKHTWQIYLGPDIFTSWGPLWAPTLEALLVGSLFWLLCLWMYRQKIFVRV
jgi:predicted acyltransferase